MTSEPAGAVRRSALEGYRSADKAGTHTKPGRTEGRMGLGGTAKKLQKVTEMAEDVYTRLNDLRDQVVQMRETTQETSDRVDRLEREAAEMRALLDALAEKEGIDVESVTAEAHIAEAEQTDEEAASETDEGESTSETTESESASETTESGSASSK